MRPDGTHRHALVRDRASDELPTFLPDGRVLFFSIRLPTIRDAPPDFLSAFISDTTGRHIQHATWPHQETEIDWLPRQTR